MHLVIIAWLYIIGVMAMTLRSVAAGIAMFVVVGLGPVALLALLLQRRHARARDAAPSVLEREVRTADDGDA